MDANANRTDAALAKLAGTNRSAKNNPELIASLKADAKQRQREGLKQGDKPPAAKPVNQKIGEREDAHDRQTDAALAKLHGTNRQYVADAPRACKTAASAGSRGSGWRPYSVGRSYADMTHCV